MTESLPTPESNNDNQRVSARRSRRALWVCGAIVFLLVAAVVYVNLSPSRPLRIAKETTYITEPLTPDGKEVDYFAAIQQATSPEGMATDENGYRLVVQHLGEERGMTPGLFADLCGQLGLDVHSIRPDMMYRDPWDFLEAYAESAEFDEILLDELPPDDRSPFDVAFMLAERLQGPWTLDELPMMASWLAQNGPALDLLGKAVRKPSFQLPLIGGASQVRLDTIVIPYDLMRMQSFTGGLQARARHRIATGDLDGALHDTVTLKRLGRLIGHNPTEIGFHFGIVFESLADSIGVAGSLEHPPSREQLEDFIHELDSLPPPRDWRDTALTHRLEWLSRIQSYAAGRRSWQDDWGLPDEPPFRHLAKLGVDWSGVAFRFNRAWDDIEASDSALSIATPEPPSAVSSFFIHARSKYVADALSREALRWWRSTREMVRCHACETQMHRIVLAMLLYERDHGTLPPAWSVDAAGNPLHSWRVLLLPYLGHKELHKRIRLDEPWDSDYNRTFHGEAMPIYRCPSDPAAKPGQATYSVIVGSDMPFEAGRGKQLSDFGPKSSDMILLVERIQPVGWMTPTAELTQAAADEGIFWRAPKLALAHGSDRIGSHHRDMAMVGLRSGAVKPFPPNDNIDDDLTLDLFRNLLRGTNTDRTYRW